jgi:hypothetical protein
VSLSTGAVAWTAPLDKRELEARADFAAGRYQKAVDGFASLFADTADPIYLRNIARCYQKMKRPQEAIDGFQEYLHKAKNLTKGERQEIDGYIREMEALKVSEAAAPVVAPPPAAPPAPMSMPPTLTPPPTPTPSPTPSAVGTIATTPAGGPAPGGDGRGWRIAGIATGAAGVAFIAVGIAFGAAASNAADSVSQRYSASTESDGKRDVTLQWVGYGVGGAALATGALLYLHGLPPASRNAPERTASLRGGVIGDRNGGTLQVQGSF